MGRLELTNEKNLRITMLASIVVKRVIGKLKRANECRKPRRERSASLDNRRNDEFRRDRRPDERKRPVNRSESSESIRHKRSDRDQERKNRDKLKNGSISKDDKPKDESMSSRSSQYDK